MAFKVQLQVLYSDSWNLTSSAHHCRPLCLNFGKPASHGWDGSFFISVIQRKPFFGFPLRSFHDSGKTRQLLQNQPLKESETNIKTIRNCARVRFFFCCQCLCASFGKSFQGMLTAKKMTWGAKCSDTSLNFRAINGKTKKRNITTKNAQICTDASETVVSEGWYQIYNLKDNTKQNQTRDIPMIWPSENYFGEHLKKTSIFSSSAVFCIHQPLLGSTRHIAWPSPNLTPNGSAKFDIKSGYSMVSVLFDHLCSQWKSQKKCQIDFRNRFDLYTGNIWGDVIWLNCVTWRQ